MNIPDEIYKEMGMDPKKEENNTISALNHATFDDPVFCRMNIHPIGSTLLALTGVEKMKVEEDYGYVSTQKMVHACILDHGHNYAEGRVLPYEQVKGSEFLPATDDLKTQYRAAIKSIACMVTLFVWPEVVVPENLDKDPVLLKIEPIKKLHYWPEGVYTIDQAEAWVLKNKPEFFVGMCANSTIGDFLAGATLPWYGEEGEWQTNAGREEYTKRYAAEHGYEVGVFDYTEYKNYLDENRQRVEDQLRSEGLRLKEFCFPHEQKKEDLDMER